MAPVAPASAALAGIGFTMSPFISGQAFPDAGDFAAAILWGARTPQAKRIPRPY